MPYLEERTTVVRRFATAQVQRGHLPTSADYRLLTQHVLAELDDAQPFELCERDYLEACRAASRPSDSLAY